MYVGKRQRIVEQNRLNIDQFTNPKWNGCRKCNIRNRECRNRCCVAQWKQRSGQATECIFLLSFWRAAINRLLHSMLNAPAHTRKCKEKKNVVKETSAGVRCVFIGKMNCELYANESCENINMVFIVHHNGEWCMASWMTKRIKIALDPRCHFIIIILSLKLQSWQSQSECIWFSDYFFLLCVCLV